MIAYGTQVFESDGITRVVTRVHPPDQLIKLEFTRKGVQMENGSKAEVTAIRYTCSVKGCGRGSIGLVGEQPPEGVTGSVLGADGDEHDWYAHGPSHIRTAVEETLAGVTGAAPQPAAE